MGLFDKVKVRVSLPPGTPDVIWQTKDLRCQMLTYEIREDGSLWAMDDLMGDGWARHEIEPRLVDNFTGEMTFYDYGPDKVWWEFSAYFVKGQLKELHQIEPAIAAAPKLAGEE